MPYYDTISRRWHRATGHRGGAVKEHALNNRILARIGGIAGRSILELGAGNGYFGRLMIRRFSGQGPERWVITDVSSAQLEVAQREFAVPGAEYSLLDVRRPFPFEDGVFDLILATMLFNELATPGLRRALAECRRVTSAEGRLIAAIVHPAFVESLARRGLLREEPAGRLTMPGAGDLRLPVVPRSREEYDAVFRAAGFAVEAEEIHATPAILNEKPGLRRAGRVPVALLFECTPSRRESAGEP